MTSPFIIEQINSGAQALKLPDDITDKQIAEAHGALESIDSNLNWWRGDLYSHVAKVRPTKRANDPAQLSFDLPVEQNERVQFMMEQSASPRAMHRMACRVAGVLPPEKRKPGLSWDFHAVVLEEWGVFVDGQTDQKKAAALGKAVQYLDWIIKQREEGAGDEYTLPVIRQMIRDTRAKEEALAPTESGPLTTAVGHVMREVQTLTIEVRKMDAARLAPDDITELRRSMRPIIDFYQSITPAD